MENALVNLSEELAAATEAAAKSVVTVFGRARLPASGIHWSPGIVVAAEHTVRRDEDLEVGLPDGTRTPAGLVGRDPGADLALLRIPENGLAVPARAGALKVGQFVLAVGRSAEAGTTASLGVVSMVGGAFRTWRGGSVDQLVRLDLSLYPGSSGAAVVDSAGKLIGLATSGLSRIAPLAIPAATVDRIAGELVSHGHVSRAYLGTGLQPVPLPAHLVKRLGIEGGSGVMVLSVEPEGPAERAGVLLGDILVAVGGAPVTDTDDVQAALDKVRPGSQIALKLIRGGELAEVRVTAGERQRGRSKSQQEEE